MQLVQVRDFKAHLARYLRDVEEGESIAVTRHGRPVALVTPPRNGNRRGKLSVAEWLERGLRDGTILPAEDTGPLPKPSRWAEREGRAVLRQLLRDRRKR